MIESSQTRHRTLINRLRATLEQEIFFGANLEVDTWLVVAQFSSDPPPQNPFRFRPESHLCGNVGLAAEQLSSDILGSRLYSSLRHRPG